MDWLLLEINHSKKLRRWIRIQSSFVRSVNPSKFYLFLLWDSTGIKQILTHFYQLLKYKYWK